MTHCNQILEVLKRGSMVTPLSALTKFSCFRLSARIYDLRKQGHSIDTLEIKNNGKIFAGYVMPEYRKDRA